MSGRDVTVSRSAARAAIRALEGSSRQGLGPAIEEFRRALRATDGRSELDGKPDYVVRTK